MLIRSSIIRTIIGFTLFIPGLYIISHKGYECRITVGIYSSSDLIIPRNSMTYSYNKMHGQGLLMIQVGLVLSYNLLALPTFLLTLCLTFIND